VPASLSFLAFTSGIINMSNGISEKVNPTSEVEALPASTGGPVYNDEKVDYNRSGAIDAETIEHAMTVVEAARAYPAASWWAFVMSCTIVSSHP
jgi:SP family general alpha glucoside:H+ symporter-like MFS transporter